MLLPIHIAAGGLTMVLGAVALSVRKGGTIHRRSGLLFVYEMLIMGFSASFGFLKSPMLPFGAMFYWLWRVRGRRALPVDLAHSNRPTPRSRI